MIAAGGDYNPAYAYARDDIIDEESEDSDEDNESSMKSPKKEHAGSPPSGMKGGQDFIIDEPNVFTSPVGNPFTSGKKKNKKSSTKKSGKKLKKKDPNGSPDPDEPVDDSPTKKSNKSGSKKKMRKTANVPFSMQGVIMKRAAEAAAQSMRDSKQLFDP